MAFNRERELFQYHPGAHKIDLLFPNRRETALGSLGFQAVYNIFNLQPEFTAEKWYFEPPPSKTSGIGTYKNLPSAEILALTIAYELDLLNFISALLKWRIEPLAEKRKGPLVIAGGVLPLINPLPLAPFVDIFLIGDGELLIPQFAQLYHSHYLSGKTELLATAAEIPGHWVPASGPPLDFKPLIKPRVSPLHSVLLSPSAHFGEMFLIEVGRGCPRFCKFCASAHIHQYEFHLPEEIIKVVREFVKPPATIGLIGSALSDYPYLENLISLLVDEGFNLGLSSLRPDVISENLTRLLARAGVKTLTLAPEAGSLKLRQIAGKAITEQQILSSVQNSAQAGITALKLYFLLGLPGEDEGDLEAVISLLKSIQRLAPEVKIEISANAFIPKPHTPFQWAATPSENYLKKARSVLRKGLPRIKFTPRSAQQEILQALISNGDERVGLALLDSIRQNVSLKQALKQRGTSYLNFLNEKSPDYAFPWDSFQAVKTKEVLLSQWQKVKSASQV
jgi:radical SAM superfamily enzyme YgiQ (UPF0313 family)